jgi:hypothetical protein
VIKDLLSEIQVGGSGRTATRNAHLRSHDFLAASCGRAWQSLSSASVKDRGRPIAERRCQFTAAVRKMPQVCKENGKPAEGAGAADDDYQLLASLSRPKTKSREPLAISQAGQRFPFSVPWLLNRISSPLTL